MMTGASGKIITFYSYKGGVGRSMILANVAWILASNGKRVLVLDWDLEAPGLHRYFHPFLADKNLSATEGLIDFLTDFVDEAMTPSEEETEEDELWYKPFTNILRYAVSLKSGEFPGEGTIDFVPAGKQGHSYAVRVNAFDWQNFYERLGGGAFLEAVKEKMRAEYDYILIDSRTGISDTSGICTVQMPDDLVVFFSTNNQSILGAAGVAASVAEQWRKKRAQDEWRIFPVLSRVERAEQDKLDSTRDRVRARFTPLLQHLSSDEQDKYWNNIEVPYIPWYAYEEVLAALRDNPGQRDSLLAAIEQLVGYLTAGAIKKYKKSRSNTRFGVYVPGYEHDIFVSYAPIDNVLLPGMEKGWITTLIEALKTSLGQRLGESRFKLPCSLWIDEVIRKDMPSVTMDVVQKLENSAVLLAVLSPGYMRSQWCLEELQKFLDKTEKDSTRVFVVERDFIVNHPQELSYSKKYKFYEMDNNGYTRTLGIPVPREVQYHSELNRLAVELIQQLTYLKEKA